jgi:cation transport ATPase
MGLATTTAIMEGTGEVADREYTFRSLNNGTCWETNIDVLDKNRTITRGQPIVTISRLSTIR